MTLTDLMITSSIKKNVENFVSNKERRENGRSAIKCLDQGRDRDPDHYHDRGQGQDQGQGQDLDHGQEADPDPDHVLLIPPIILDLEALSVS